MQTSVDYTVPHVLPLTAFLQAEIKGKDKGLLKEIADFAEDEAEQVR